MEANAEVFGGLNLAINIVAVLIKIRVIKNGGAARERQFREADKRARAGGFFIGLRPDSVVRFQPREEVVVLRSGQIARERLVEMVMRVDETRQHDLATEINHRISRGGQLITGADLFDDAILGVEATVFQFTALAIHRDEDSGVFSEQGGHDE